MLEENWNIKSHVKKWLHSSHIIQTHAKNFGGFGKVRVNIQEAWVQHTCTCTYMCVKFGEVCFTCTCIRLWILQLNLCALSGVCHLCKPDPIVICDETSCVPAFHASALVRNCMPLCTRMFTLNHSRYFHIGHGQVGSNLHPFNSYHLTQSVAYTLLLHGSHL